jgi:hypothetical protein
MAATDGSTALTPEPENRPEPDEGPGGLSDRDRSILALERNWYKYPGAKEQVIREQFDMPAVSYYQILNALIDTEAALAHDPMLVKRLRRMRTTRQRSRTERRLGDNFA